MDILTLIFQKIDEDDLQIKFLDELCLDQLPLENQKELWDIFVRYAIENQKSSKSLAILEEYFDLKCPTDVPWKLYTFMLDFTNEELNYFASQLKYPLHLYFTDLCYIDDGVTVARKLSKILGIEDYGSVIEFYETIYGADESKKELIEYIRRLQNGWFIDCDEVSEFEEVPTFPPLLKVSSMIIENMSNSGITLSKENTTLIKNIYCISMVADKMEMLGMEPTFNDDVNMFREFGPLNTSYNCCYTDNRYGGCRMFLCREYEDFDSDGEEIEDDNCFDREYSDWFRGYCDVCEKEIGSRYHALRHPLVGGGWQGCLCSEECLRKNTMDGISSIVVDIMMGQLKNVKIRDR